MKHFIFLFVFSLLFTSFFSFPKKAHAATQCTEETVSVKLSLLDPTDYDLVGELCWKDSLGNKTVQLLVHGLTYDRNYWDWPQSPQTYSYVQQAINGGYATFNIDRLGDGESDHPLAVNLTTESSAYVAHQLVQKLRDGELGNASFDKVITVGHSFGAVTTLYEAGVYQDVDGVMLTGLVHIPSPTGVAIVSASFHPAQLDPKFANANLPLGYLTTIPGTRGSIFYNTATADPTVITKDEELKQTASATELATITDSTINPLISQSVHVPVILVVGQKDLLFCNELLPGFSCANSQALMNREATFFSPHACLETFVLSQSGHDINLHPNANLWFAKAMDWSTRRVGPDANHPPTQPCP